MSNNEQAAKQHAELVRGNLELLAKIRKILARHSTLDKKSIHWGHVGDQGYIRDELAEIADHFNTSIL